jgi:hypothetical protein
MISAVFSLGLAACAGTDGTAEHVHNRNSMIVAARDYDPESNNVRISPTQYNTESQSFERPWPFGPESSQR